MKLIYIKSTITPKDYSVVREILKKERGEKLAPFVYKLSKLDSLEKYLNKENINYEVYQENFNKSDKKAPAKSKSKAQELKKAYQDFAKNQKLKKELSIGKIRPALVISNNAQNEFDDQIIVAPLTSEPKEVSKERPFTVLIKVGKGNGLEKVSKILLNRVQTIDIEKRLRDYIGRASPEIVKKSQGALKIVFD
ncbi:PemK-like protein [Glomus cerebriforme]|uniref:PemK-like protein n=1 Tax=Glomus cerebriforme TaxID=658196 RepID=A0A397SB94_9GLOM|nr:PemK-like protein [Glomus cerebriforme]